MNTVWPNSPDVGRCPRGIPAKIKEKNPELYNKLYSQGGFISPDDLQAIEAVDRFIQVIVRCNNGRFTCPVQNAKHFVDIITEHGDTFGLIKGDYVRDIAFPVIS